MSEARRDFVEFEAKMSDLFDSGDEENGHVAADAELRRLIDRLLRWWIPIEGGKEKFPLNEADLRCIRRGLAFYDQMPKWYA